MHQVNDNLFNDIEVRKTREFAIAGCMLLDKVLASGGGAELMIVIAKLMMLLSGPATKRYNRQADKQHSTISNIAHMVHVTYLHPETLPPWPCYVPISNRECKSGCESGMQTHRFYGQQVCHKLLPQG